MEYNQQQSQPYPQNPQQPTNGKAVASLVLGIISAVFMFFSGTIVLGFVSIILAVIGLVLGVQARREMPQGTAGIPMLEVFRREGVCNVVCVVTRYFGGILLGAGGLLRAYTKSAKDALDAAGISVVRRWVETALDCSYAAVEKLKQEITAFGGIVAGLDYGAAVTIHAYIPEESAEDFKARIFDVSAGGVTVRVTGEDFRAVPRVK
mgnify:CR=1 FL=1